MDITRRTRVAWLAIGVCAIVTSCSGSSDSAAVTDEPAPTVVSDSESPESSPVPEEPSATAESATTITTAVPTPPTPPTAPTVTATTAAPPAAPSETAVAKTTETADQDPPAPAPITAQAGGHTESFTTGLLQDQFCVIDIDSPDTLNLRSGPSTSDEILLMLDEDQCRLFLTGAEVDGWLEVVAQRDDGQVRGWVSSRFIAPLRVQIDPNTPTTVITVAVEYMLDSNDSEPSIDSFQLSNAGGLVIGFLDSNGQITVPLDLDLSQTRIAATFPDDRYCAWTGELESQGVDDHYTASLFALCA